METKKKKVVKCVIDDKGRLGVNAMGLVEFPAIEENFVALSKIKLSEINTERKMLYGAALVPDKYIPRLDENGEEFYIVFDKETIMKSAHMFIKNNMHHNHTLEHKYPVTGCVVVESWIVESEQDKSRHFGFDVPVGTWMIGTKVEDDDIWSEVKNGSVKGFSIEGLFNEVGLSMSDYKEEKILAELKQLLIEYTIEKLADSPYLNEDGTFKGGFDGCVSHMQEIEGHSEESAKKICGYIAQQKGA